MRKLAIAITAAVFILMMAFPTQAIPTTGTGPYPLTVKGPGIDEFRFQVLTSGAAQYSALTAGTVDAGDVEIPIGNRVDALSRNGTSLFVTATPDIGWWGWDIANQRAPTNFTGFREGIAHLVNKEKVKSTWLSGQGAVINSYVSKDGYGCSYANDPDCTPPTGYTGGLVPRHTDPAAKYYYNATKPSTSVAAALKADGFWLDNTPVAMGDGNTAKQWHYPNGTTYHGLPHNLQVAGVGIAIHRPISCGLGAATDNQALNVLLRQDRDIMVAMGTEFQANVAIMKSAASRAVVGDFGYIFCMISIIRANLNSGQQFDFNNGLGGVASGHGGGYIGINPCTGGDVGPANMYTSGWGLGLDPDFPVFTHHSVECSITDPTVEHDYVNVPGLDAILENIEFNNVDPLIERQLFWKEQYIAYTNTTEISMFAPVDVYGGTGPKSTSGVHGGGFEGQLLTLGASIPVYPYTWSIMNMRRTFPTGKHVSSGGVFRHSLLNNAITFNAVTLRFVYDAEWNDLIYDTASWARDPRPNVDHAFFPWASIGVTGIDVKENYNGPNNGFVPGLHVAFTLNSNLKFHDGTPVTGSDVVFTYLYEAIRSQFTGSYFIITNVTASTPGPGAKIDLWTNTPGFFVLGSSLGQTVLPKHVWCGNDGYDPTKLLTASNNAGVTECPERTSGGAAGSRDATVHMGFYNYSGVAGPGYYGRPGNTKSASQPTSTWGRTKLRPNELTTYTNGTAFGTYTLNLVDGGTKSVTLTAMIGSGPFVFSDWDPSGGVGHLYYFTSYIRADTLCHVAGDPCAVTPLPTPVAASAIIFTVTVAALTILVTRAKKLLK